MGRTPDRHPGSPDYESEVQFSDESMGDPSIAGSARYTLGAFRYMDSTGVFDTRRPWANFLDGPAYDVPGVVLYKAVTGTIPVTRVDWYANAAKTLRIASCVYTYPPATPLLPSVITSTLYKADGTSVLRVCVDQIAYSGAFEVSRTRTFS